MISFHSVEGAYRVAVSETDSNLISVAVNDRLAKLRSLQVSVSEDRDRLCVEDRRVSCFLEDLQSKQALLVTERKALKRVIRRYRQELLELQRPTCPVDANPPQSGIGHDESCNREDESCSEKHAHIIAKLENKIRKLQLSKKNIPSAPNFQSDLIRKLQNIVSTNESSHSNLDHHEKQQILSLLISHV